MSGKVAAEKARDFLRSYETSETRYSNGGAFWPLAKWATEGFDSTKIEALTPAQDIQHHPILGKCYRVKILMQEEAGSQGTTRGDEVGMQHTLSDLIKAMQSAGSQQPAGSADGAPAAGDGGGSDSMSNVGSDSSSSSSSSRGKKKKKADKKKKKKAKSERKLKEKAAKKLKRLQEKERDDKKKLLEETKEKKTKERELLKQMGPLRKKLARARDGPGGLDALTRDSKFHKLPVSLQTENSMLLLALTDSCRVVDAATEAGELAKNMGQHDKRADEAVKSAAILKVLYTKL